jgi:hypothetical protein
VDPPTFILGWTFALARFLRRRHQSRRKVTLTVHRAYPIVAGINGQILPTGPEHFYIRIANASRDRDIVVTHMWFDTEPRVDIHDRVFPLRLPYSAPWETAVPVDEIPADPEKAMWLARCLLAPDDKTVKSRPRDNVPPVGVVPRG